MKICDDKKAKKKLKIEMIIIISCQESTISDKSEGENGKMDPKTEKFPKNTKQLYRVHLKVDVMYGQMKVWKIYQMPLDVKWKLRSDCG